MEDTRIGNKGLKAIILRSMVQIVRRPIYWGGFFIMTLFMFLFLTSMLGKGLPTRVPAAVIDKDGTSMSRELTQELNSMQMVNLTQNPTSFTEARHLMQKGDIYGYFLIPENFQADLLAGRKPSITFYTNMTYFVPASMLFKTFKATAIYTKAGVALNIANALGADGEELAPMMMPVNITSRAIGNPWLNYGVYIANSFVPCLLQLMIFLMTVFSIGQEMKYGTSRRLMQMADDSIIKAIFGKLLPQTVIWWVVAIFMMVWLFRYNHYPMNGSWGWMILSELMFVLACQGFALFVISVLPNLRLSLSVCALLGILSFSIAAFSFPVPSMYPAIGIFSYIVPTRYNFLIYVDQALNGIDVAYSKMWFIAYIIFMLLPFTMLWHLKRDMKNPVYVP